MTDHREMWKQIGEGWLDVAGPHVTGRELEAHAHGAGLQDQRARVERHLKWCIACAGYVREYLADQSARALQFEPRRLKVLGWETAGAAARLAAGHEGPPTYESLRQGESQIDLQVSPSEELFVTATEGGEALIGWVVRLQRVDAEGAVLADERSETTDVTGRASLGSLQTLQPLGAHQRFRVVAVSPWE